MREIKGYEGLYCIDDNLNIITIKTGKIKTHCVGSHGYYQVDLFKKNKRTTMLVHRIIAEAFLENKENKRIVNHKNGIRTDNLLSNLEWATYSENTKHAYEILNKRSFMKDKKGKLCPNSKPVLQVSLDGKIIKKYDSIMDAERETMIKNESICNCLHGRSRKAGGYEWRYFNEKTN